MKIVSADRRSWLSIERKLYDSGHSSWSVEGLCNTGSGMFHGRNDGVQFERFGEFVEAFERFILNRDVSTRLSGTYGTSVCFSGNAKHVTVQFRVGDADHISEKYAVVGELEIDQEFLNEIARDLRELSTIDV